MSLTKSVIQPPFDIDAQRFIYATGITNFTQKRAINYLVRGLKQNNLWTKMAAVYPMVGGTAWTCKFNLINPIDSDLAFRLSFVANPTITYQGVDWNGTTQYANTFLVPSTNAILALNSTHISYYSRENVSEAGVALGVADGTNNLVLYCRYTDNNTYVSNNAAPASLFAVSNSDSRGHFVNSRIDSTHVINSKNGVATTSGATFASVAENIIALYIGCRNAQGSGAATFATIQCAFASIGSGLTTTDCFNFYNIVQQFQIILNRAV